MTTETKTDIVAHARETLRLRWKHELRDERIKLSAEAEAAWIASEKQRHDEFVKTYKCKNTFDEKPEDPYSNISDGAAIRLVTPFEDRYHALAEQGYLHELLYVWLARQPDYKATLDQAQVFFADYMPVEGTFKITKTIGSEYSTNVRTYATGLSKEFSDLLCNTWGVEFEFGKIRWYPGGDIDPSGY